MDQEEIYHGTLEYTLEAKWKIPALVAKSEEMNRPKMNTNIKANEYQDHPETLDQKLELLANMIMSSQNFVVYTGAGISTSAGINDYATRAKNSKYKFQQSGSMKTKKPTLTHYTLAAMQRQDYLKYWVQQNHDGLAQKAGYPNSLDKLNEIHGSWWDKSNTVVPMKGTLKEQNINTLEGWIDQADFTLALGTSLSGLNADRICTEVADRFLTSEIGQGLAIIGLQRTQLDNQCQLRIYADLDNAMKILAKKMKLKVIQSEYNLVPFNTQILDFETWVKKNPQYEQDVIKQMTEEKNKDKNVAKKFK